jgi:hypothetical protein
MQAIKRKSRPAVPPPLPSPLAKVLGRIPFRLALAGGWIDQPFVSRHNLRPPGSMVVVGLEPNCPFLLRSGMATGTRAVATRLWNGRLPRRDPAALVRELYQAENQGHADPSGSQDMIGLIYPGINRLDYDFRVHGGVFPAHIEPLNNLRSARWLEKAVHLLPVGPRPDGYTPLEEKNFDPQWITRLGRTGRDCFEAIRRRDVAALGASFNECMKCWQAILPGTVRHSTVKIDLAGLLRACQSRYPGAMYSGCGGGYLLVASEKPVPGACHVTLRDS